MQLYQVRQGWLGYTMLHNTDNPNELHEVLNVNDLTTYTMLHLVNQPRDTALGYVRGIVY